MDDLNSLPENPNTKHSKNETEILTTYFPKEHNTVKELCISVALFALLANPWIDGIVRKMIDISDGMLFAGKIVVYIVLLFVSKKYS